MSRDYWDGAYIRVEGELNGECQSKQRLAKILLSNLYALSCADFGENMRRAVRDFKELSNLRRFGVDILADFTI